MFEMHRRNWCFALHLLVVVYGLYCTCCILCVVLYVCTCACMYVYMHVCMFIFEEKGLWRERGGFADAADELGRTRTHAHTHTQDPLLQSSEVTQ